MDACANEVSWQREQQAEQQLAKSMEVRVEKAVVEFRKNPDAVSKKTEEAIKHMGVKPDPKLVERLAAQVVAYRMESRKTAKDSAAGIVYEAGVSEAVRAMVEKYESKH
jgi:hypothetical protein